ncbi:MAG: aldo/keto reductase [Gammaproteobacteria bacterium]
MSKIELVNLGTLGWSGLYGKISEKSLLLILDKISNDKNYIELHTSSAYEIINNSLNLTIAKWIEKTNISIHLKLFSQPEDFKNERTILNQILKYHNLFGNNLKSIFIHKPLIDETKLKYAINEIEKLNLKVGVCLEKPNQEIIKNKEIDFIEIPLNLLDLKKNIEILTLCKKQNKKIFARSLLASGLLASKNINKKNYSDVFRKRFMNKQNLLRRQNKAKTIRKVYKDLKSSKNDCFEWFCYDMVKILANPDHMILGGSNPNQVAKNIQYNFFKNYKLNIEPDKLISEWSAPYFK